MRSDNHDLRTSGHRQLVKALRRLKLPGWIGGGVLDWYQIPLRYLRAEEDCETYFGARIRCATVDFIQRTILFFGVWEPGISRVIEGTLKPGDVFVDIGANIGYESLLASSVGSRVVAIEPSPATYSRLTANVSANPQLSQRIRTVNLAVSDSLGELDLYEFGAFNSGATTTLASRRGTKSATVGASPLLDILTPDELARVKLIKIDVEGLEPVILNDILGHLDAYPSDMSILSEANPQDDREAFRLLFGRLLAAGFRAFSIENKYSNEWYLKWRPTPLQRVYEAPAMQSDLLLCRDRRAASAEAGELA